MGVDAPSDGESGEIWVRVRQILLLTPTNRLSEAQWDTPSPTLSVPHRPPEPGSPCGETAILRFRFGPPSVRRDTYPSDPTPYADYTDTRWRKVYILFALTTGKETVAGLLSSQLPSHGHARLTTKPTQ